MQLSMSFLVPLLFMLAACGEGSFSEIKLTNGRTVESNSRRSVVYFFSSMNACTGTFIRHNLMLTAAHCVRDVTQVTAYFEANSIPSTGIISNPRYNQSNRNKDIALIFFPNNTAPETSTLCQTAAKAGTAIRYVGFGKNGESDTSGRSIKREGQNIIDALENGVIYSSGTEAATRNDGAEATIALGDSGGPLFDERRNCILGVASASTATLSLHANVVLDSFDWVDYLVSAAPATQRAIGADIDLLRQDANPKNSSVPEPIGFDGMF
jgi:hypothetical protein